MDQTVNQATMTPETKTFSQAEVNKIVEERLIRDRQKYADYEEMKAKALKFDELEEAAKTDLQKANEKATALQQELDAIKAEGQLRLMRESVAKEAGVPASLLTADTEEACKAQAKEIIDFARPQQYPSVRDGGEPGGTMKTSTREQFNAWWNQAIK